MSSFSDKISQFLYAFYCFVIIWNFSLWQKVLASSKDDFKCLLPDVSTNRTDLDLTRFRNDFTKVSEVWKWLAILSVTVSEDKLLFTTVKFPGLIGPLNERLICKIKCIDGNWVGPLCSTTKDGRFQPIFRECIFNGEHPLLLLSFRNATIENDTQFSHGSFIMARCKQFGLYKLKGESMMRCQNGDWLPKLPQCVPTTLVTNFTGDAPPTISFKIVSGSASVEPSGELLVYPESTVYLDCIFPRGSIFPEWSWTQTAGQYEADWSSEAEEKDTHYRLILSKVTARNSDLYTCASPNGETNTVTIKVVNVVCPQLNMSDVHLIQYDEGIRLGQSIHLSCHPGYHLNGSAVMTCMGSGGWSGRPPTCVETYCPMLKWPSPRLSLVAYNSSVGGRALFRCAWGYRLVGTPGVECGRAGEWSGEPPTCVAVYCPSPIMPEHGFLLNDSSPKDGKYPVGDLVLYGCEDDYQVMGESSIVCTEDGYWSHPPPFCVMAAETTDRDTIFIENTTLVYFQD